MTAVTSVKEARSSTLDGRQILFVGNGPYRNRGCEAIVRGTVEILTRTFGENIDARSGVMASPSTVTAQLKGEHDPRVRHFSVSHVGPRLSAKWWMSQANARLGASFPAHVRDLDPQVPGAACALQLGGDNYSLDYGRPWEYMAIDDVLRRRGVPTILWGASVGPFDADPEFAPAIHSHLAALDGIFVRETASRDYLARNGVAENVHLVADPAFVMTPAEPADPAVRDLVMEGMVGINISPLVARFSGTGGDVAAWRSVVADMIVAAAERLKRPILLVPHVGSEIPDEDDFAFMASLRDIVAPRVATPVRVTLPGLGAAELKWLIAQCTAFAGARTHATIAALSSAVPTLSLSYSVKAIGINNDIFGHQDFCRPVRTITPAEFADTLERLVADAPGVRGYLEGRMPEVKTLALSAGPLLAGILEHRR